MPVLKIQQFPKSVLLKEAKPVKKITKRVLALIEDMKETLTNTIEPRGVGLAAPQIGKSLQIFIIKQNSEDLFHVFINPRIQLIYYRLDIKTEPQPDEGCLSIKGWWGAVRRAPIVTINYLDEKGKNHTETHQGMFAVIIQHEFDHLQGKLFIHRIKEQQGQLWKEDFNAVSTETFLAKFK